MAFIVETGTGVPGANSYASIAEADSYHSEMGNLDWENYDTAEKQTRLIRGSRYLDGTYSFPGTRSTIDQGLQWPRWGAIDQSGWILTGVPENVIKATCEAGLYSKDELYPVQGRETSSESVGPVSVSYASGGTLKTSFGTIDLLLTPLGIGKSGGGQVKVTR